MQQRYAARREVFLGELRELRPDPIAFGQRMLMAHPEIVDGGPILGHLYAPPDYYSLSRFDELAVGADFAEGEWTYDTAYDSVPSRDPTTEGPAPESRMLHILRIRYQRLEQEETLGHLRVDDTMRAMFQGCREGISMPCAASSTGNRITPRVQFTRLLLPPLPCQIHHLISNDHQIEPTSSACRAYSMQCTVPKQW